MKNEKTLRLLMPQWQGGNNASYPLGARLLAWLAPEGDSPIVEVPVAAYGENTAVKENGIVERKALLKQLQAARNIIEAHSPDRIVVFGGDCLVTQAPFAYLNERYDGKLGVLWIDAHPDITTPKNYWNAHAMVLGNLLGEGDPEFAAEVKSHIAPAKVLLAGVDSMTDYEEEVITRLGLRRIGAKELAKSSEKVLEWVREQNITHLAIHIDLDILDPKLFRSLLFANPMPDPDTNMDFPIGELSFAQLTRLVKDVSSHSHVVGLGITEHMPWDAINLKNMLSEFPLLKN